jgi:sepiapterin reductase
MVLISRSAESLREAARMTEERGRGAVTARCHEMDLSDLDAVADEFQSVLESSSHAGRYDSCLLVNNAGSLGPVGLASSLFSPDESNNLKELRRAVDLNVTSSIWVSAQFTKKFLDSPSKARTSTAESPLVRIVNISSLCALEPFPTMSIYSAGKAGRDMFHRALAKEHSTDYSHEDSSSHPNGNRQGRRQIFKALNYAPGLCDTQMSQYLADCAVLDEGLHEYYTKSKEDDKWIRPEDTAKKLIRIIDLDEFESGSHVDYWDV